MVLNYLVNGSPPLAFLVLVIVGLGAAEIGARWGGRAQVAEDGGAAADDGMLSEIILAPILGLFALMVAFTFGQALVLEQERSSAVVSATAATQSVVSMAELLPDLPKERLHEMARQFGATVTRQIRDNTVQEDTETEQLALAMRREVMAFADEGGSELLADHLLSAVAEAMDAFYSLQVNALARVPVTVLSLQSLYYLASFFLTGYVMASRKVYQRYRFSVLALAFMFSLMLYMILNAGRAGMYALRFDPFV